MLSMVLYIGLLGFVGLVDLGKQMMHLETLFFISTFSEGVMSGSYLSSSLFGILRCVSHTDTGRFGGHYIVCSIRHYLYYCLV